MAGCQRQRPFIGLNVHSADGLSVLRRKAGETPYFRYADLRGIKSMPNLRSISLTYCVVPATHASNHSSDPRFTTWSSPRRLPMLSIQSARFASAIVIFVAICASFTPQCRALRQGRQRGCSRKRSTISRHNASMVSGIERWHRYTGGLCRPDFSRSYRRHGRELALSRVPMRQRAFSSRWADHAS